MTPSGLLSAIRDAVDTRELDRAYYDLQRHGTPTEVADALPLVLPRPDDAAALFRRLHEYCFWEKDAAEPFTRVSTEPEWTFFRGPEDPAAKELVVGFAGRAGNVNLSAPILLQHLDARIYDLLVIRDLRKRAYVDGAAGTNSFDELLAKVRDLAAPYRSLLTIGGSMGGGPALEAGIVLGARRAVSLAGGPHEGLTGTSDRTRDRTELWCFYGDAHPDDSLRAAGLQECYPEARRLPLPGVGKHSVLHAAFRQGTLTPLLRLVLSDSATAIALLGPPEAQQPTPVRLEPSCTPPAWAFKKRRRGKLAGFAVLRRIVRGLRHTVRSERSAA
jgi:hypothetical protein